MKELNFTITDVQAVYVSGAREQIDKKHVSVIHFVCQANK